MTGLRADCMLVTLALFQGHNLVSGIFFDPVDGFSPNLHKVISLI